MPCTVFAPAVVHRIPPSGPRYDLTILHCRVAYAKQQDPSSEGGAKAWRSDENDAVNASWRQ